MFAWRMKILIKSDLWHAAENRMQKSVYTTPRCCDYVQTSPTGIR